MLPFQSCSEWGLQGTLRRRSVGGLLPRLSILTAKAAVYFCCTFLEVAFTGCYPALCPAELGLSSRIFARSLGLLDQNRLISGGFHACDRLLPAKEYPAAVFTANDGVSSLNALFDHGGQRHVAAAASAV